jgi:hypothetical protein
METMATLYSQSGSIKLLTSEDLSRAREDRGRISGTSPASFDYYVPETAGTVVIDAYVAAGTSFQDLTVLAGPSPEALVRIDARRSIFQTLDNEYSYFTSLRYACAHIPASSRYVKIILADGVQVGHVEIASPSGLQE